MSDRVDRVRTRREPPRFRPVEVVRRTELTPRLMRVTLAGSSLEGLEVDQPAASVRLLTPSNGNLIIPTWMGNEFLFDDGERPIIRTFTPRYLRKDPAELDLDIVIHDGGATSAWVQQASRGDPAAVSGTGRGYDIDTTAPGYLLAGDETALPAIGQLLEAIPDDIEVTVIIEIADPGARLPLPGNKAPTWAVLDSNDQPGAALLAAMRDAAIGDGARVWVAGEAAAMFQVRRHLFEERSLDREDVTVRGYWKLR